ncbi:MAG: ABC transporter substrate-binding protein [Deltaproteobacteria bacterium]|jgi:peptide/nickel transport system substrate-binding protein|nr:ABC transporter substrate-binding protein [Deltaproteobacteria bacterium]
MTGQRERGADERNANSSTHRTTSRRVYHVLLALSLAACRGPARAPDRLTMLVLSRPEHLDPRHPEDALGASLGKLLYRGLMEGDPVTFLPRPALAVGANWVDATRYRVTLRSDARFHDGTPVTADDVVATYESVLDASQHSRLRTTYARLLRAVRAVDPRTIDFELHRPDGSLETLLQLGILPQRDARALERRPEEIAREALVGSGPMRLARYAPDSLSLDANGAGAAFRALDVVTLHDPNTLALRLLHGEGDVAELKPELYPLFEGRADFEVASARTSGMTYLGVHCEHGALVDVAVRRALAMAIDRASLQRAMLGARAVASTGVLPPSHWAYTSEVARYPFDPAAARRALVAARGESAPPLRLTLRVSSQRFAITVAQALTAMLHDVGVEVDVRPSELATLLSDLRAGRFDLTLLTVPDLSDPFGLGFWFGSASIPTPANPTAGGNRWRFRDTALDEALDQGLRALGPDARRPHYQRAQQVLAEQLPVIPLWHADVVFALRRPYRGLRPRGDGQLDFLLRLTR